METIERVLPAWALKYTRAWSFRFTLVLAFIVTKIVFATLALTEILGQQTISQQADENSNITFWVTVAGLALYVWYLWKFRN